MKKYTIAFIAFLSVLHISVQAQSLEEVIENYTKVNGSQEQWDNIKTMKMDGKFSQQGMEFPIIAHMKRPNSVHTSIKVMGMEIIQAYDGKDAWMINPLMGKKDAELMGEEDAKQTKKQGKFEDPLLTYKTKGHKVQLAGKEEIEGTECFKIEVEEVDGDKSTVFIDTENYLKLMERSVLTNAQTEGAVIEAFFSDYKEVENGLLMWHAMDNKIGGQSMGTMIITKWEFNPKVNDSIFKMPK